MRSFQSVSGSQVKDKNMATEVLSHAQRVRRLYKTCNVVIKEHWMRKDYFPWTDRHLWRHKQLVMVRAEFDKHKNDDPETAEKVLQEAEKKVAFLRHEVQWQFPSCPGGVAWNRIAYKPDWLLDLWHPLEKAQYPEYFARRDVRKREFMERWEKKYGKPTAETH